MEITKNTLFIRQNGGTRHIHYIGCPYIKDWDINGCSPVDKIRIGKGKLCPMCEHMAFISMGAKDFPKKRKDYDALFKRMNAPGSLIRTLYVVAKAKTELKGDILYIRSRQDNWYIDTSLDEVRLFHNNYGVEERKKGEAMELFTNGALGFHEHELLATSIRERFREAIVQISKYNFEKAQQTHKKKKKHRITFSELDDSELDEKYWGFG